MTTPQRFVEKEYFAYSEPKTIKPRPTDFTLSSSSSSFPQEKLDAPIKLHSPLESVRDGCCSTAAQKHRETSRSFPLSAPTLRSPSSALDFYPLRHSGLHHYFFLLASARSIYGSLPLLVRASL